MKFIWLLLAFSVFCVWGEEWSHASKDGVFTLTQRGNSSAFAVIRKKFAMPQSAGVFTAEIQLTGTATAFLQAIYRDHKGKTVGWEGTGRFTAVRTGFRKAELPFRRRGAVEVELQMCMNGGRSGGTAKFRNVKIMPFQKEKESVVIVPGFESAAIRLNHLHSGSSAEFQGQAELRPCRSGRFLNAGELVLIPGASQARMSLFALQPDTSYEVRLTGSDKGKKFSFVRRFKTMSRTVPIGKTILLDPKAVKNGVIIGESGTENAYLRITAAPGTRLHTDPRAESSITLDGVKYVILENLTLRGAGQNGIKISNSSHVRIVNCDIADFGRQGKQRRELDGKFYVGKKAVNYDAGIFINGSSHIVIERCFIHRPAGTANPWYFSHPAGPCPVLVQGAGGIVIRHNDFIGGDFHRWNDGIEGHNNSSEFGGFRKDAEICGNAILFGNDDGTELDGGQENCRFFNNRIENFLTGISLAPCHGGPSYVINNRFLFPGDVWGARLCVFKNGFNLLPGGRVIVRNNSAGPRFQGGFTGFGSTKPFPGFEKELKAIVTDNKMGAAFVLDRSAAAVNGIFKNNTPEAEKEPCQPFPVRPCGFVPEVGTVFLTHSSPRQIITVENSFPDSKRFTASGVEDHGFFTVSPGAGVMGPGRKLALTVSLNGALKPRIYRGAFSLRLEDGRSQVISVYADLRDFSRPVNGIKIAGFKTSPGTKVIQGAEKNSKAVVFEKGKGAAEAEFYLPETGEYLLFARSRSTGFTGVNISFDGQRAQKSSFYRSGGDWGYSPVSANDRGSFFTGARNHVLKLTGGKHRIKITPRSDVQFDAFYLVPYKKLYDFMPPLTDDASVRVLP